MHSVSESNISFQKSQFKDDVVLITGAAGSIGSVIAKQFFELSYKQIILLDQAESKLYDLQQDFELEGCKNVVIQLVDIRNEFSVKKLFERYQPTIVFHAAAYKHVPLMEENPYEAVRTNILGTILLSDLSSKYNVKKFIFISTDKAVKPTSVMGASKCLAEVYLNSLKELSKTKYIITRFGNVLGSSGSVIPLFQKQIDRGGPVTVTHEDIRRYFMTIKNACELVLEASVIGDGGEIFVFDMGNSTRIIDLANQMINESDLPNNDEIKIEIIGLRPGEKLTEELFNDDEVAVKTTNNSILKVLANEPKLALIEKIKKLVLSLNTYSDIMLVKELQSIIPQFVTSNKSYK